MKITKYDKTTSEVIRASAGYSCEVCGIENDTMQCMHDISRTYVITRYDSRNLICGCASCHAKTTKDPHHHHEVFIEIKGAEEVRLNRERAHSGDRLKPWEKDDIRTHWIVELQRIKALRAEGIEGKIELIIPETLL